MTDVLIYSGLGKNAALRRTLIQRTPTTSYGCELYIALGGVGRRLRYLDYLLYQFPSVGHDIVLVHPAKTDKELSFFNTIAYMSRANLR